ncbi:unnamed protein product [Dracunculus medinensis]|uniref:Dimer_Tnp_hAT domain-containing protein n=1 Tax=Dracunculus medinensis TaxID=318479 RepID=A0A0N4U4W3_DRAME|nr:unnamed protein product [Dracunculus medinensis]
MVNELQPSKNDEKFVGIGSHKVVRDLKRFQLTASSNEVERKFSEMEHGYELENPSNNLRRRSLNSDQLIYSSNFGADPVLESSLALRKLSEAFGIEQQQFDLRGLRGCLTN